jgi:rhamnogalacturonan endolyase
VSNQSLTNLWVGLTAPEYVVARTGFGPPGGFGSTNRFGREGRTNAPGGGPFGPPGGFSGRGGFPPAVDWQRDARFYQYWVRADANGRFAISHARPGTYTLRAIAANVLGEFSLSNIVVSASETRDVATLRWTPERFGRTLWEIGVPDRTAREFRHGDDYWHWGTFLLYSQEFPKDLEFVVGRSDWRRDWNYVQPPRLIKPLDRDKAGGADLRLLDRDNVRSTTWTIRFEPKDDPKGKAVLRLAFCGSHAGCRVEVLVNGQSVGDTGPLPSTSAMQREGVRAYWVERRVPFDAARLHKGENTIGLLSHADSWAQGVLYDYLRLELQEP